MTNYRPVSLLTIFSKAPDKGMHIRLSHHLNTNNILVTEQNGFKKGASTEDAAFRLKDSVFKSIHQKKKKHVGGIVCDLANASDCGNHDILLVTLHFFAIRGVCEDWLRFCLTNGTPKKKKRVQEK